jgi:hypothetical protein
VEEESSEEVEEEDEGGPASVLLDMMTTRLSPISSMLQYASR